MKIALVLTDNMLATSMLGPTEMWLAANQFVTGKLKPTDLQLDQVAMKSPVRSRSGLLLQPTAELDSDNHYDLIYLPALWRNPRPTIRKSGPLLDWLQAQYESGATICGVGTGCCLIAATGLLDHKPATTHWYYFDQFQRDYPAVELKRQHFITEAGSLYCAASINSLADLTVHFIQRCYGKDIALHIERHFSHEIRRAYDTTSYVEKSNANHPDETVLQAQLWLQDHLSDNISVEKLAGMYGMSERNFARRFKKATGQTPGQYLQTIRINTAQDLLHYSNLTISEITDRVGFGDVSYFARIFKKHRSVSPREYRTTVRAKLFSSNA